MTNRANHSIRFLAPFVEGIKTPLTGFEFMNRNPKLWRYGILPVLVNLLLTALVLVGLIGAGVYFATVLHPKFDPGYLGRSLEVLTFIGLLILALGLAFAFWILMQIVACGYFYGRLALQVERLLGTDGQKLIELPWMQEVTDTVGESISLLLINLAFLVAQFVPVVGTVVGIGGSYYFTCFALGREYWDYPLSLRGFRRKEKHLFANQHKMHTLGLGTAVMILLLIPIVNAVLLTTAVTGAVLLHRKLLEDQNPIRGPRDLSLKNPK